MFKKGDFMIISPIQERIILTPGNLIVRASAGTGKTLTMVKKIEKEIDSNKSHKVVTAITFTIKAAQEIKERLVIDLSQHFIGTNNSFAIEEVIKPFMKDVYGEDFNLVMDTDYSLKVNTFEDGIKHIKENSTLCSYRENKKNFIFELAQIIVKKSFACQLYLQAKYFKIYIDEYQDCDKEMHNFFMYLCDQLHIETFVVGDEKQSIYIWRGAYPDAFRGIWEKDNFKKIFMIDNFRSCQQIQNYSNLLCEETRNLYVQTETVDNIIWLSPTNATWPAEIIKHIDTSQKSALLRFRNNNAKSGAAKLISQGMDCVYIPKIPIADITTESAWLYSAIAKYIILEKYSVYDFISEIPVEGDVSKKTVSTIKVYIKNIEVGLIEDIDVFETQVNIFANYLGYSLRRDHVERLFQTISDSSFHVAFEPEKFNHIAITFHSSKGLEFDQVIIFAEDYRLSDMENIYNHYVSVTRAKTKLIIVKLNNNNANMFQKNIEAILSERNSELSNLVTFY